MDDIISLGILIMVIMMRCRHDGDDGDDSDDGLVNLLDQWNSIAGFFKTKN